MRSDIAQGDGHVQVRATAGKLAAHRARGHAADRPHPGRSGQSRTWCSSPRWAIPTAPTRRAACSARRDGGQAWQRTLYQERRHRRHRSRLRAGQRAPVYAALWQTRRPPWNVYPPSNGPGSGLYQVARRRRHLDASRRPWPAASSRVASASPSRRRSRSACLRSSTRPQGGLYRSDDAGGELEARERRQAHLATRLVFRRHHRRSRQSATWSTSATPRMYRSERRRQALSCRSRARPAATTTTRCGSTRTTPRARSSASTRARS